MFSIVLGSKKLFEAIVKKTNDDIWKYLESNYNKDEINKDLELNSLVVAGSPTLSKSYGVSISLQDFSNQIDYLVQLYQPKNVILISSASVYGLSDNTNKIFFEDSELLGNSEYALEKIHLENLISNIAGIYNQMNFLILRPAGYYNCFNNNRRNSLIDRILNFEYSPIKDNFKIKHNGKQIRDFCNFDALVYMILHFSWHENKRLSIMNLSTSQAFKICEIIEIYLPINIITYLDCDERHIHSQLSNEFMLNQANDAFSDGTLKLVNQESEFKVRNKLNA